MERSSDFSSTGNRPFSMNNPFRNGTLEHGLNHHSGDGRYNQWRDHLMNSSPTYSKPTSLVYRDASNSSSGSLAARSTPTIQRNATISNGSLHRTRIDSNNPFRDDIDAPPYQETFAATRTNHRYPTAEQEKEQLRQGYKQASTNDTRNSNTRDRSSRNDLPPSYDEIASNSKNNRTRSEKSRHDERPSSSRSHSHRKQTDEHSRHSQSRPHGSRTESSNSKKRKDKRKSQTLPPKNVDSIDKLDVTGLFGGSFHHDGPFDAVTPHRNKNNKAPPVLAFMADGPNSSIGGVNSKKSALDEVFGNDDADDEDDIYQINPNRILQRNVSVKDAIKTNIGEIRHEDAKSKAQLVHGHTTVGLGSTTFLDGAPAPAKAISQDMSRQIGLRRNKTMSQNLRNNSDNSTTNRYTYGSRTQSPNISGTNLSRTRSGPTTPTISEMAKFNKFGDDEEDIYLGVPNVNSNSRKKSAGGKFLQRVKSLKVGRR